VTPVGGIGLGALGAPMAVCLARADHRVRAHDIDPARVAAVARRLAPKATRRLVTWGRQRVAAARE